MIHRLVGRVAVTLGYHPEGFYRGVIHLPGGLRWSFDELRLGEHFPERSPESAAAFDEAAAMAVEFGAYYTTGNRSDAPEEAPPEEIANAIDAASEEARTEAGYRVRRPNPAIRKNPSRGEHRRSAKAAIDEAERATRQKDWENAKYQLGRYDAYAEAWAFSDDKTKEELELDARGYHVHRLMLLRHFAEEEL